MGTSDVAFQALVVLEVVALLAFPAVALRTLAFFAVARTTRTGHFTFSLHSGSHFLLGHFDCFFLSRRAETQIIPDGSFVVALTLAIDEGSRAVETFDTGIGISNSTGGTAFHIASLAFPLTVRPFSSSRTST